MRHIGKVFGQISFLQLGLSQFWHDTKVRRERERFGNGDESGHVGPPKLPIHHRNMHANIFLLVVDDITNSFVSAACFPTESSIPFFQAFDKMEYWEFHFSSATKCISSFCDIEIYIPI